MAYWLMKSEPSVFGIDDLKAKPKQHIVLGRRTQLSGAQLHA